MRQTNSASLGPEQILAGSDRSNTSGGNRRSQIGKRSLAATSDSGAPASTSFAASAATSSERRAVTTATQAAGKLNSRSANLGDASASRRKGRRNRTAYRRTWTSISSALRLQAPPRNNRIGGSCVRAPCIRVAYCPCTWHLSLFRNGAHGLA